MFIAILPSDTTQNETPSPRGFSVSPINKTTGHQHLTVSDGKGEVRIALDAEAKQALSSLLGMR